MLVAAAGALTLLVAACGEEPRPPREVPVVLQLTRPADAAVVRADRVQIAGTVKPARATVQVRGDDVPVLDGRFTAEVALEPGANLIDVAASAGGRRADFAAMRVVREVRVPLPDVVGGDEDTGREALEGLGLNVTTEDAGGFFDPLLPGDPQVCAMRPDPGTQVLPGSDVVLQVARDC